jgi:hypothetical protein
MNYKGMAYDGSINMFKVTESPEFKSNYLDYIKWLVDTERLQGDTAPIDYVSGNSVE